MMRLLTVLVAVALVAPACAAPAEGDASEPTSGGGALVGGAAEARFQAAGYLTGRDGTALCGATLVAPDVVVTAAHCAYRNKDDALAFGVGEIAAQKRVAVASIHYHPGGHVEQDGAMDLVHALRLNDLAYLVLERPVDGVTPALPATSSPSWASCRARIIGYGTASDGTNRRASVSGCVVLEPRLGSDAILEIRPETGSAVCHRDGDEGHAAIAEAEDGTPVLLGVYVGSVTQSFSDCKKYVQLLNGYEDVAGHADFFAEALRASRGG